MIDRCCMGEGWVSGIFWHSNSKNEEPITIYCTGIIDQGAVCVHMNDGISFELADHKACAVDDTTAYVMYRDSESNRVKARWLSLVCMTRIEQVEAAA